LKSSSQTSPLGPEIHLFPQNQTLRGVLHRPPSQILCIRHSITATKGYINFFIDNDTVIKRLKYGVRPEMGSTKHCKTDYDIWIETIHILNCLPCTRVFTHVKGHQDDALYAFSKVRSPLTQIAHYYIEMDKIAAQCRTAGTQPMMITVLPTSKIALVLNSKEVVTNNVKEARSHARNMHRFKRICATGTHGHPTLSI